MRFITLLFMHRSRCNGHAKEICKYTLDFLIFTQSMCKFVGAKNKSRPVNERRIKTSTSEKGKARTPGIDAPALRTFGRRGPGSARPELRAAELGRIHAEEECGVI